MSIPVDPRQLAPAVQEFGSTAYLLTSDDDGRPRVNQVTPSVEADRISATVGGSASRNASARPSVAVLWPPVEEGGFTLIADGTATMLVEPGPDTALEIVVSSAVLHRRQS